MIAGGGAETVSAGAGRTARVAAVRPAAALDDLQQKGEQSENRQPDSECRRDIQETQQAKRAAGTSNPQPNSLALPTTAKRQR
jgi:hypothetical protein